MNIVLSAAQWLARPLPIINSRDHYSTDRAQSEINGLILNKEIPKDQPYPSLDLWF